jgi:precorrin isomerase
MHASGMTDLVCDLRIDPALPNKTREALEHGSRIIADCEMVRAGLIKRNLPEKVEIICTLNDAATREIARSAHITRSAAAVGLWRPYLDNSIIVIGNAPTALFALLDLMDAVSSKPSAIIAMPVGFVGAVEAKAELAANPRGVAYATLLGRRGGSAMAAAAFNAITAEHVQ